MTIKSRGNYGTGGYCSESDCEAKNCDDCFKYHGKWTGYSKKTSNSNSNKTASQELNYFPAKHFACRSPVT